ncbi:MAG: tRNA preQ1(34) S-adenosylmethionine ribosyltransferase-isomerase QueA [Armatimonadota bacterium]|nr:tRNA preQ1(34) S-adenosylmethionine ribosyltransferase-isomerase QueA [Armatimonadota bacterium]
MVSLSEFDYSLPEELIAQQPIEPRDTSRLLVVHRHTGSLEHRIFSQVVEYLRPGDVLVINDTRVIPARLRGEKEGTGGRVEVLIFQALEASSEGEVWKALVRGKRVREGTRVRLRGGITAILRERDGEGWVVEFQAPRPLLSLLHEIGEVPVPPYIHVPIRDPEEYQTVYARRNGSVAAPTAGRHFTPSLLSRIEASGVKIVPVTLHIGPGTFLPVRVEEVTRHRMMPEAYEVSEEAAEKINEARCAGGKVIAIGTSTVRTLESVADEAGRVRPGKGWTDLFILPGYRFKVVDALVTNFHLPKSTLLMLVCAFAGRALIFSAYQEAILNRYRFGSFGDAMLIL